MGKRGNCFALHCIALHCIAAHPLNPWHLPPLNVTLCSNLLPLQAEEDEPLKAQLGLGEESGAVALRERLAALTTKAPVMLFMKGTPDAPRCGFSRSAIELLRGTGTRFETFDILEDEAVRQGLKEFSNWPTFP